MMHARFVRMQIENMENWSPRRSRLRRKLLRDSSDPFSLPDHEFRGMFRLSREVARDLLDELVKNLAPRRRSDAIPFHLQMLGTLSFLGHGSYQKPTSENIIFCQSQTSMSRSIHRVLSEMLKLCGKYIRFPKQPNEISSAKMQFMEKFGMPGVVCAVDGTHIAIIQPPDSENGHLYCNRKQFYSLNVLAACDANGIFVFGDANYPGSTHDSAIYTMTSLKQMLPQDGSSFMLGDSGFPADGCMLTPIHNCGPETREERYNRAHKIARNIIERTFGMLKARFRSMLKHRTLHYNVNSTIQMVYVCMMLHNICITKNIPNIEDGEEDEEELNVRHVDLVAANGSVNGRRVREQYIARYF